MNILALDLSTRSTGYAIAKEGKLDGFGCLTQPSSRNYIDRLYNLVDDLIEIIKNNNIELVVCEEVQFGDVNTHTFKTLMYLQARLVCETYFYNTNIQFEFFQPSEWRSKVGIQTGPRIYREQLKKADIQYVKETYNIEANDDICDAIALLDSYIKPPVTKKKIIIRETITKDENGFEWS